MTSRGLSQGQVETNHVCAGVRLVKRPGVKPVCRALPHQVSGKAQTAFGPAQITEQPRLQQTLEIERQVIPSRPKPSNQSTEVHGRLDAPGAFSPGPRIDGMDLVNAGNRAEQE